MKYIFITYCFTKILPIYYMHITYVGYSQFTIPNNI